MLLIPIMKTVSKTLQEEAPKVVAEPEPKKVDVKEAFFLGDELYEIGLHQW